MCGSATAILEQTATNYRTLRNTLRFTLGNLYDFDPVLNAVPLDKLEEIDRWAMHRLNEVDPSLHPGV